MKLSTRRIVGHNPGKAECKIAFMFACPGKKEMKKGRVVSGVTGENLSRLIKILHEENQEIFVYVERYDYCITNASSKVYYKGYLGESDKRTLPKLRDDVYTEENILRLQKELKGKIVIAFGFSAKRALENAGLPYIDALYHLGFQGINRISKDCQGKIIKKGTKNATQLRLEVIAKDILRKLDQMKEELHE